MLASLLFPYDDDAPKLIDGWLDELHAEGCLIRYEAQESTYIEICNWLIHQKIDKPSESKIPSPRESSRILANPTRRIKDQGSRIKDQGKDQGEDRVAPSDDLRAPKKTPGENSSDAEKEETALQAACKKTWAAYSSAYRARYHAEPVRNAKVNAQVKQFCQSLPYDEAPLVAEFFVWHNSAYYVRRGHDCSQLLTDVAKLRTEWATGRMVTATAAAQTDRTSAMLSAAEQVKREMGYTQ
ncbi:MAG TPA: hypothetical protein VFV57_05820 [Limnobacter sp.]|nr:hypothetical protein [Limnobacter sp.]